ncbi:hypothetical protein BJV82DRAFT_673027 [Fennellomyces sp. T-0311]|nr:hypothetical protein BJV82DRAFT_673027 [Fennellomyces sp. T-0311]
MISSPRSSIHNQKAKLAADYNDLLKQLSSPKMTVVGCYSIGETIGEGTYGKVKLGVHQITGKRVAIKKISKQHAPLMAREIHHHRQLRHPNIITLFEILSTESAIFIVSEYCPNGELFDLLTESGRFTEQRAQAFFRQLVDAIRYCHERNIVHRDLKLENILLDADQNAKICDFGFARHADDKQLLDTFCGSLAYSAPEVISQKRYTGPETDIWSLGIILYTLLAGELPFDDDSEIVMRRKIIALDYHLPSYFSSEARDLIENILKLDPKERLTMDQIVNHPWLTMIMDDGDDDCASVPSTRCSTYSDADSLFSGPMRHEDDDDFDLCSEISSPRSYGKASVWNNYMSRPPSSQFQKTPHEKNKFASRPPRFSAPTVSSRARITQPYFASARASLPSNLPSSKAMRSSIYTREEPAMAPIEQRLFTALTAAGFDENAVRNMRSSDAGNALGTLWHMLMDNLSKNEPMVSGVAVNKKKQLQSDSSAESKVVDQGTQTEDLSLQPPASPVRPTVSEPLKPAAAAPAAPPTAIEGHPKVSVSSTQSRSTSSSATEKAGWFSSVKSWFGTTKQQQLEEQQQRMLQTAAFRAREIQESLPAYQSGQKYRRHALQLASPPTNQVDQFSYNSTGTPAPMPQFPALTRPAAAHNKPSLDSYYKASNAFGPARPPTALTSPKSTNTLSVVTTPPPSSTPTTAVPATAVEIDVTEKRYAQYRSANRAAPQQKPPQPQEPPKKVQHPQQPQKVPAQQEPRPNRPLGIVAPKSPAPTTTTSTPVTPIRTTSPTGSPLSSQTSSLVEEEEDDDEDEASSPASSISTVEAPEDDNKLKVPPPSPTPTRSWPLAFRENNASKRFDFAAPRSQLGIYNDGGRRKPLGAKVIIEEEEEEEE